MNDPASRCEQWLDEIHVAAWDLISWTAGAFADESRVERARQRLFRTLVRVAEERREAR